MKKFLLLILLMLPIMANAYDAKIDGIYYNLNRVNQTAEVTCEKHSSSSMKYYGDVIIPKSFTFDGVEYIVTAIGKDAFDGCSSLASVDIPNSVTVIGDNAFNSCCGLTSINIPNSVTTIEDGAFYHCTGLTSLSLPNSVTYIGCEAFTSCTGLVSVSISGNVSIIVDGIFSDCQSLLSVNIPEGVTTIEGYAFWGCKNLTTVIIPSSVTKIEDAFPKCSGLKTVYCYVRNVPSTNESAFEEVDCKSAILYVPASAINEYKATAPWNKFGTILPIEDGTTRIDAASNVCNIRADGSVITVSDYRDGENVSVYSVGGQLISTAVINNGSAVINTNLQAGSVVIVKIGQKSVKLTLN